MIIPGRVIRFFRNSSLIFSLPESSAQLQNSKISLCEYLLDKIYPLTRCRNRFPFWRQLFAVQKQRRRSLVAVRWFITNGHWTITTRQDTDPYELFSWPLNKLPNTIVSGNIDESFSLQCKTRVISPIYKRNFHYTIVIFSREGRTVYRNIGTADQYQVSLWLADFVS